MARDVVLVVDDDPNIRDLVALTLEAEDYLVRTARNGAEALDAARRDCPDVVLLDMRMPVLDGWGFARELRRYCNCSKIIVMTAALNAETRAAQIDADGYVAKPFDLDQLLDEVRRLCSTSRSVRWLGDDERPARAA